VAWLGLAFALLARKHAADWENWWSRQSPLGKALVVVASLLGVDLSLAVGFWLTWPYGVDQVGWLRAFFYLGGEYRPASLFAALQLWLAGWLAWRCWQRERHGAWLFAAVVCFYAGMDEWFGIHEFLGGVARQFSALGAAQGALQASGLSVYVWQLVFLPVALIVGALLLRAFWRITSGAELAWLVAGAAVFLGGALGFESAEAHGVSTDAAWWASARANATLLAEELMEMLGVTIVVGVFARRWFAAPGATAAAGATRGPGHASADTEAPAAVMGRSREAPPAATAATASARLPQ
jgi:hypothetical protein